MHRHSISQLKQQLATGEISAQELTEYFLKRSHDAQTSLNSFITIDDEGALKQAQEADKRLKNQESDSLLGIPIAHKDIFCTQGLLTSCASKMLSNFIAPYDATAVSKLQAAGAICLGKTNMDEFAMGSSNETSFYGPVKNPWHLDHVPGGSSGGSAAAVAAGLVCAATGTDTGGSIRQPAALCGVTGIKPTYGLVSRFGMIAFASSLDQGGVIARSAADTAIVLEAMAGYDDKDATSAKTDTPTNYLDTINQSLDGLTVGLPKEFFTDALSPALATLLDAAMAEYKRLGVNFKEISLPHSEYAIPTYYIITPSECSSNLARYDGIRFGYRAENPKDLADLYRRTRGEGFGHEVKRRILIGTYTLSAGYYDAYYLQAKKVRQLISNDFQDAFKEVDVILCPTTPSTAFKIGEKITDPVSMYYSDLYTIAVNLAGLPAMSLPCGFSAGLPGGMQLIANYYQEAKLLNVAHQYQCVTDWHQQHPAED